MRYLGLLVLSTLAAAGCPVVESHSCTLIGCEDGVRVVIATHDDRWAEGDYVLELRVDGERRSCTAEIAGLSMQPPMTRSFECDAEIGGASLSPKTECHEVRTGDAVSQQCVPIDGAWTLEAGFSGAPRELGVALRRNDELILDQSVSPVYQASRPNGPDCDPLCRQALVEMTVPR